MPEFVPALELNAAFYTEVVAPAMGARPHGAALLGWGSDVLGFDTARSTDHGWGPRLQVFVDEGEVDAVVRLIDEAMPAAFRGWPVRYGWDDTPVDHHVEAVSLGGWLQRHLGVDPRDGLTRRDWLLMAQQQILGVVRGSVYSDPSGQVREVRRALSWYPEDVWLWLLACQWKRIAQEEAFAGRAAEVGDELGSRLVAARLVRELMRLCFLLAREYWPYTKWFGSAFSRLAGGPAVGATLSGVLDAPDSSARDQALAEAFEAVARRHNATGVTDRVDPAVRPYYGRPFSVLMAERFVEPCLARVSDPWLRSLPLVGSVDQAVDSTDVLSYPGRSRRMAPLYEAG